MVVLLTFLSAGGYGGGYGGMGAPMYGGWLQNFSQSVGAFGAVAEVWPSYYSSSGSSSGSSGCSDCMSTSMSIHCGSSK